MVFAVCRRVCKQQQDSEDAFQASFLVLARKAHSVRPAEAVGNWLHGVAYRTALRARATAVRRLAREKQVANVPHPSIELEQADADLERLLDQELNKLADKYRLPLVLCELEGRSRREVARQLKLPEGTLSSRLATARKLLAARLTRRGVTLASGMLGGVIAANHATAAISPQLLARTSKAGCLLAAGQACTDPLVSTQVTSLMEGTLKTMLISKLKLGVAMFALASLVGLGGYSLSAAPIGLGPNTPLLIEHPANQQLMSIANQELNPKEPEIAKPARIGGRFTDIETGNPVAGALVQVCIPGGSNPQNILEAISDSNGIYELRIPFGHGYFTRVIGPGGLYTQDEKTRGRFATSPNEPRLTVDFELEKGSKWNVEIIPSGPAKHTKNRFMLLPHQIGGNLHFPEEELYASSNLINVRASTGRLATFTIPLTNQIHTLRCWIQEFPGKFEVAEATLQFEGNFDSEQIKGNPEVLNGGKAIGLRDMHNRSAFVEGADVVVVGGKALLRLRDRPISKAGSIEVKGKVMDEIGKPIQGAQICAVMGSKDGSGTTRFETSTDVDGAFLLRNVSLSPGIFEPKDWISLAITKTGHAGMQTKGVTLAEVQERRLVDFGLLVLKAGHELRGKVVDDDGNAIEGALISNNTSSYLYRHLECRTDKQGRFTMRDMPKGLISLLAQYGNFREKTTFQLDPTTGECLITIKQREDDSTRK
jgi:RNA polymerase sigma factor (sigma-70 family)